MKIVQFLLSVFVRYFVTHFILCQSFETFDSEVDKISKWTVSLFSPLILSIKGGVRKTLIKIRETIKV